MNIFLTLLKKTIRFTVAFIKIVFLAGLDTMANPPEDGPESESSTLIPVDSDGNATTDTPYGYVKIQ